jgi:hypothetical protein
MSSIVSNTFTEEEHEACDILTGDFPSSQHFDWKSEK